MKITIATLLLLIALPVEAQVIQAVSSPEELASIDLTVDLARVCAHEAGWSSDDGECSAIAGVIGWRALRRGVSFREMLHDYASGVFDRERTDARSYFAHLSADGAEPRGWGSSLPWASYQPRWRDLLAHARQVLVGEAENPCPAGHWSAPRCESCERRMEHYGWVRASCFPSRNEFWVPSEGLRVDRYLRRRRF